MTTRPRAGQRTSRAGVELIKTFEGFRPRAARLPDGRHVVGYGHTQTARQGVRIAEADAHALLIYDLLTVEAAINEWVFSPLTQNQFDALVSFAFNIGLNAFRRSDVLRRINEGSLLQAAGALEMWRLADLDGAPVVIDALVRRRAAEKALFLTPPEGFAPAPGVILRPQVDFSAYASVPRHRPEEVTVPLDGDEAVVARGGAPAPEPEPAPAPEEAALLEFEPEAAELEPEMSPEPEVAEPEPETSREPATAEPEATLEPVLDLEIDAGLRRDVDPAADATPADAEIPQVPAEPGPEAEPDTTAEEAFPFAAPAAEASQDEDDEDWSAARAAAAAVSARLHQILSEGAFNDDDEEPSVAIISHPSPAPAADEPSGGLPDVEPFPPAAIDDETRTPYVQPFPLAAAGEVALRDEPRPVDLGAFEPAPTPVDAQPTAPYLLLGLVGLLFIIAALVSLFRAPADGAASVDGVSAVSLILGLLGVGGVSGALWLMLRGEDLGDDDAA